MKIVCQQWLLKAYHVIKNVKILILTLNDDHKLNFFIITHQQ